MFQLCFPSSPSVSTSLRSTLLTCTRRDLAVPCTSSSLHYCCCSSLCLSRRYQRSTSTRVRSSSWEEKTQKFEERQRELQEEAARAARRRARYAATPSAAAASTAASSSSRSAMDEDTVQLSPSSASITKPSQGFWAFLTGGSKGRRSQPMNPLMYIDRMRKKSPYDPDARAAQRLIDAVNGLRRRNARRQDPMTVQLSEEEKQEIVNRYSETRWYGPLYRPFRHITERQIRWTLRISHVGLLVLLVGYLAMVLVVYTKEMDTVARLSPEDQQDYAYMVQGMRYSDIFNTGKVVLDRDDPLEALPAEVRLHMVIDACREKNWHRVDWDVELRKMHPNSAFEDRDYLHIFYWMIMDVGRAIAGGGGLFNDRVLDVQEVRHSGEESPQERNRFVEMEPTELPTKTKRGFFS